jgi:hypothetical protein
MKPKTFLRLTLLTPYLLWGISALIVLAVNSSENTWFAISPIINALLYIPMLYAIGIFIWGIPYTILAFALWFWSSNRPIRKIIRGFALAPFLLAILIATEMLVLSINWNNFGASFAQSSTDFGASVLGMGLLALVFGYLSIGVVMAIYKALTLVNLIKTETSLMQTA